MTWGLRWFQAAPARRLGLLRILVGTFALGYVVVRAPHLASFGSFPESRFDPVGVVGVLQAPLSQPVVTLTVVAAVAAGVGFVAGWRFGITGPAFALLLLWVTSYRNSWGVVLHTENLMALHVLILGFTPAADAYAVGGGDDPEPHWRYGWPLRLVGLVTVLTYFVSGWAKIRFGGGDWLVGDVLRNQIAFDNLRKLLLGDFYSPLGGWLVQYGWLFPPMAIASVVVELGAPLALLGDRLGRVWSVLAFGFHVGVLALMAIVFAYQLTFVAFASFFPLERTWDRVRQRRPGRRSLVAA